MEIDTKDQILKEINNIKKQDKDFNGYHKDYGRKLIASATIIAALIKIYPQTKD